MGVMRVYSLYRDKTWLWPNGGAYFARDGRFEAWSEKGKKKAASYADGRWWASRTNGRMCFQAIWRTAKWAAPALTCFDHRAYGYLIYQRKLPAGKWYEFRTWPIVASDEFHTLRTGDLATKNVNRVRARLFRAEFATKRAPS